MILVDTNVLSELMRPVPAERVVRWVASQSAADLHTSSITQAEVLHGIMLMPAGKRRTAFETAARTMFSEDFEGRIHAFDSGAAHWYARIAAERQQAGRPISQFDAQIAAIARSAGAGIATRNVTDYEGCGVRLINPWNA